LLSKLFGGGGPEQLGGPGALGNLPERAAGGDISGPTLVGEKGPELFIPNRSGTIIPNHKMSDYANMGGGQTVNYNGPYIANMSAIDTQSAAQFLQKNKQVVWAVNQSAQRSLPMSRA